MNASRLKALHIEYNPESHFFDRKSMQFFGDTMRNYAVSKKTVNVQTREGIIECWELRRLRAVKHGLNSSAFFNIHTVERVLPQEQ